MILLGFLMVLDKIHTSYCDDKPSTIIFVLGIICLIIGIALLLYIVHSPTMWKSGPLPVLTLPTLTLDNNATPTLDLEYVGDIEDSQSQELSFPSINTSIV